METIEFNSHEQQDEFVFNIFQGKFNGYFLDVACGHPLIGNNTFSLEKYRNWSGLCIDIVDHELLNSFSKIRKSSFFNLDATSADLTNLLRQKVPENIVVDYINCDVDGYGGSLSLMALMRILDSGIKFKSITFEHEYHTLTDTVRLPQRFLLEKLGFVRLYEDVKLWSRGPSTNNTEIFEDWWIHPDYFDPWLLNAAGAGLYSHDCIKKLRQYTNLQYNPLHVCSRSFVNEYTLFFNNEEREYLRTRVFPTIQR